jgi:hypothetical protein
LHELQSQYSEVSMKIYIHRMAKYTALILLSALPLSIDVLAASEKGQNSIISTDNVENDSEITRRKPLEKKHPE